MPTNALGRWAIALAAFAILMMLVILPLVTMTFRDVAPITDSWVMPLVGFVIVDAATLLMVWAFWRKRERSVLGVIALVIMVPFGLFVTFMVAGEAIGSALGAGH